MVLPVGSLLPCSDVSFWGCFCLHLLGLWKHLGVPMATKVVVNSL